MFEAENVTRASTRFRKIIGRAVVVSSLACLGAAASAATITFTQTPVFAAVGNSTGTATLPQFNPLLGTLSKVTVSFNDDAFTASEVVNLSASTETAARWSTSTISSTVSTGTYSQSDSATALSFFGTDSTGTAADSGVLPAGGSNLGSDSAPSTPTFTYTSAATVAQFEGVGNVNIADSFSADGFTDAFGPQFGFIVNFGSSAVSITYTYNQTPAPAAAGTLLIGFVGMLVRRRRS